MGYHAGGALVSSALTPAADPGHYDGALTVRVRRANHGAPKGEQTFTLTGAGVRFGPGVDPAAPAAGSRVRLHGSITRLPRRCADDAFEPTITIRRVAILTALEPAPEPPEPPASPAP